MGAKFFDTGQHMTYLFLFILPFFIEYVLHLFHSIKPNKTNLLLKILKQDLEVPHIPSKKTLPCKQWTNVKLKPRVGAWQMGEDANKPYDKTYLWALAWLFFKVGCFIKVILQKWLNWWHHPHPHLQQKVMPVHLAALQANQKSHNMHKLVWFEITMHPAAWATISGSLRTWHPSPQQVVSGELNRGYKMRVRGCSSYHSMMTRAAHIASRLPIVVTYLG
jgi:hypothetical protein